MEPKLILNDRVIWEKCWNEEACVKVPFDGKKCLKIQVCVRILQENKSYYIELQLFGQRRKYALADVCYPVYSVGVATLTVCTSDVKVEGDKLVGFTLSVNGCVGGHIGRIPVGKCFTLFNQAIHFFYLNGEKIAIDGNELIEGYSDICYLE